MRMPALATLAWIVGTSLGLAPPALAQRPSDRPNVLLIMADDLNTDLGTYGHPLVRTPHLDRLAARGVRFDRAYTQFPLCSPSRVSMLTGLRPDVTRIHDLQTDFRTILRDVVTLPQMFKRNGYLSARVGKIFHYGNPGQIGTAGLDDPGSWDLTVNPRGIDKDEEPTLTNLTPTRGLGSALAYYASPAPDEEHTDGRVAAETIALLEKNKARPFFIAAGFYRPHCPFIAPRKYFDLYPLERVAAPPSTRSLPADVPAAAWFTTPPHWNVDEQGQREAIRAYYASISFLDANVGRVLDALDRLKLADNTIVVFVSDHGYHLGERGQWMKQTLFERSARAPVIFAGPGVAAAGRGSPRVVEFLDFFPTLAELAHLTPPPGLQGRSLMPLLRDPSAPWDSPAVTQVRRGTPPKSIMGYSIRTEKWRYTEWDGGQGGVELYDEGNDPQELHNLATDGRHRETMTDLQRLLRQVNGTSSEAQLPAPTMTAAPCTSLGEQKLPNTTISVAQVNTTGSFTPPGATNPIANLPPFCRIAGVIAPTSESQILFEVWLPLEKWNGKFAGVGNGGWAGSISFGPLAEQLRRGYATASTNTGHEAAGGVNAARFAFEKPEQLIDFAYRSHHELAVKAKAITEAFYTKPPRQSYFIGCSSGGYEGLMAAQRFPADYDGIVAGMPANNWTRLMAGDFEASLAVFKGGINNLPPSALGVLHRAVLASCDARDGVVDGVLEDPRHCAVDPATVSCKPGQEGEACLTPPQVEAARRVYGGLKDPKTGAQLYPGLVPGSEPFWPNRDPASPFAIPVAHYKWLVFGDPDWDWKSFDFSDPADYAAHQESEAKLAPIMNATSPDLEAFRQRGGKLLQYHGWNDQLITPLNSIDYYESALSFFGTAGKDRARTLQEVQSFYRLFMAPGMAHCGGGQGPNTFDMQAALEQWVERGVAPDRIVATRAVGGVVDRLRPLCPYPQVAVYRGNGDTNDAANFDCRPAPAGR